MVFQDPYSSLDPRMNVGEIIAEPLRYFVHESRKERAARVSELLEVVGLGRQMARQHPYQLSGGQRQRVGLARALSLNPQLVVADEPISALDVSIRAQILNLLARLQRDFDLTYLVIAHDLAAVRWISTRVLVMYLGRIVEAGPTEELYRTPLHPYTVALMSAVLLPDPARGAETSRIVLQGDVPSASAPPSGCRFHPRCWLRDRLGRPAECEHAEPPLRELAAGRTVACHFAERMEQERTTGWAPLYSPSPVAGERGSSCRG
jgi:oligopeptide/dipeptide ABC transporter ATP-binding protein